MVSASFPRVIRLLPVTVLMLICSAGIYTFMNRQAAEARQLAYLYVTPQADLRAVGMEPLTKTKDNVKSAYVPMKNFKDEVHRIAQESGIIITPAVIDKGYLNMALNFHVANIQRHNLQNITLYICVDQTACEEAVQYGLPAVMYRNYSAVSGVFNSKQFIQKAMAKHYLINDIINMGYSVLLSDLDVYWFKSPLHDVIVESIDYDFVIQNEANRALNIGFMYVKPTTASKKFYKTVTEEARVSNRGAQVLFTQLATKLSRTTRSNIGSGFDPNAVHFKILSLEKYPDGSTYFEAGRKFPRPCKECFLAHNNWIVGVEAKEFRFKDHLMWYVDTDEYYSSPERKYVTYDNPPISSDEVDLNLLKAALGIAMATNRTLILPPFFHDVQRLYAPLNSLLIIRDFDRQFSGMYRESTFLHHPFVPATVKFSQYNPQITLEGDASSNKADAKIPSYKSHGWDELFLRDPFADSHVIKLNLINVKFDGFTNNSAQTDYVKQVSRGFVRGKYRQMSLLT